MSWTWASGFSPNAPGIPEAQRRQAAAESLLRKLGSEDGLALTLQSMYLWEPLYNNDDGGELRPFDADGLRKYLERFHELDVLNDDEQALIRDLERVLERYPEG